MPPYRTPPPEPRVVVDRSAQVLRIDCEPAALGPLTPSPAAAHFVSAGVLAHKVKQVDDAVRMAVELMLQRGAGKLPSRRLLLARLADALAHAKPVARGDAVEVVFAACRLGGVEAHPRPSVRDAVDARVAAHRTSPKSAPVGFYTASPELARAYAQDRMLQTRLASKPAVDVVARALAADPWLQATYVAHNRLGRSLAGRRVRNDLSRAIRVAAGERGVERPARPAFLPASRTPEGRLAKVTLGDASLIDALVRGVKAGEIDLRPGRRSSWREMQLWALEPLLRHRATPEAKRLRVSRRYEGHLEALFRASYGLARETHAKDVEIGEEEEEHEVIVGPDLTVEPLATHYARMADAYRFARELLEETFGAVVNDTPCPRIGAAAERSVWEELVAIEAVLRGASETARHELGMAPDAAAEGDVGRFEAWRAAKGRDADLRADARMMVPVSYDRVKRLVRVWAFFGWAQRFARVRFEVPPRVSVAGGAGGPAPSVEFIEQDVALDVPEVAELRVRGLLDRAAFRKVCDAHRERGAIVRTLQE